MWTLFVSSQEFLEKYLRQGDIVNSINSRAVKEQTLSSGVTLCERSQLFPQSFASPVSAGKWTWVPFASLPRLVGVDWLPLRVSPSPLSTCGERWRVVDWSHLCLDIWRGFLCCSCCCLSLCFWIPLPFKPQAGALQKLFWLLPLSLHVWSCSLPHPISLSVVLYKNLLFFFYPAPRFPDFQSFSAPFLYP